ncbi:MAG: preprotein translocase subunit SecG [Parcubacteria group bacterium]|nr:MAG: preprotein translocase subunit SecG [Parcubacteria group bacterium]
MKSEYLNIAQIVVSIVLIVLILLQQRGTALGSAFGGQGGGYYATRRGVQKQIFWATVVFGAAFIVLSLLNLIF